MRPETITIESDRGFQYSVLIAHHPEHGFSLANYRGSIISDCQLGRIMEPMSDDDREWEMYEERFSEWRDEIVSNLKLSCKNHFNRIEQES